MATPNLPDLHGLQGQCHYSRLDSGALNCRGLSDTSGATDIGGASAWASSDSSACLSVDGVMTPSELRESALHELYGCMYAVYTSPRGQPVNFVCLKIM